MKPFLYAFYYVDMLNVNYNNYGAYLYVYMHV